MSYTRNDHSSENWKAKPSIKKVWTKSIFLIAKEFAVYFTTSYRRDDFLDIVGYSEEIYAAINDGLLNGLCESCNLVSASTFYGFARTSISLITPDQAYDLLDYALSRFEKYIPLDYADGEWNESLLPPSDMTKAFTGYIWSSLGSPKSSERWRAAHAVKRLYELECQNEINALLEWMQYGKVDCFGYKNYPFYELHAKQYLLIALTRSVIDNPNLLKPYSNVFSKIAINGEPHALIQKYAVDIAFTIEAAFPNSYSPQVIEKLNNLLSTPFPIKYSDKYGENFDTPWHINKELIETKEISFGIDFPPYWFKPLGRVFGVSEKQIEDLARQVVLVGWGIKIDDSYLSDPRQNLWKNRQDRGTWHSHGSYPRIDDYRFYLSYHAMLCIASKLLQAMPVVHHRDGEEDEWSEWLRRHLITRTDNKWLADRRDSIPIQRRAWVKERDRETWQWEIVESDFLEALFIERDKQTWLNVAGEWNEYSNGYDESFYVCTLLVPVWASQSLLNSIISNNDDRGYKLASYINSDFDEVVIPDFCLKKWLYSEDSYKYLDEYDPFSGNIDYSPYTVSDEIIQLFQLSIDTEYRDWTIANTNNLVLHHQIWSEDFYPSDNDYIRKGYRMQASFSFLKDLCAKTNSDLIIEVQIRRSLTNSSYSRSTNGFDYIPPYNKIYLLSKDGKLRDTRKSYKIREAIS